MIHLTRQQQMAVGLILFLLLTGWAVKSWRLAHPPGADTVESTP